MFDLRSDTEIEKWDSPLPVIDGVKVLRTPVFRKEDYSPEMMAKCVRVCLCVPWTFELSFNMVGFVCRRFQLYSSGKTEVWIFKGWSFFFEVNFMAY